MKISKGTKNRAIVEAIRAQYQNGYIGLDEAQDLIEPMLVEMNRSGAKIAKRFGKKFKPLTFNYIFR